MWRSASPASLLVAAVYFAQDSLPVIGLLWNPRLLPFLYLVRYLMMMVGAVELLGLAWNLIRDRSARSSCPTSGRAPTSPASPRWSC